MKRFEFAIFKGWWACKVDSTWPYVLVPFRNGAKLFHPHYLHLFHWNEFANGLVFTSFKLGFKRRNYFGRPAFMLKALFEKFKFIDKWKWRLLFFWHLELFQTSFFDSFTFRVVSFFAGVLLLNIRLFLFSILDTKVQMFPSDRPRFSMVIVITDK